MPKPLTSLPIETTRVTTGDVSISGNPSAHAVGESIYKAISVPSADVVSLNASASLPVRYLLVDHSNVGLPGPNTSQMIAAYEGVGHALTDMTDASPDEWKIDSKVYNVARAVAQSLMQSRYPTPTLFAHGTKSVVFTWSNGPKSLYLTVSADHVSALLSTPDRIQRRIEFSLQNLANPCHVFPAIESAQTGRQVVVKDDSFELVP